MISDKKGNVPVFISNKEKSEVVINDLLFSHSEPARCPMTIANCDKFKVTGEEVRRFCRLGCCSDCEDLFYGQFGNRHKGAV